MSYSSQTARLKKLVEDLEKPENIQKLNTLSLFPTFEDMKSKQNSFEQIFAGQAEANANLRNMKSASAIRRDLEKTLILSQSYQCHERNHRLGTLVCRNQ